MRRACEKAYLASIRTGELIIAYECPDCSHFHIGHADLSQRVAHEVRVPKCLGCGKDIPENRLAKFVEFSPTYCSKACGKLARKRQFAFDASLFGGET